MVSFEENFIRITRFLDKHTTLINCHLVDFITDELYEKCLSQELKSCFEEGITQLRSKKVSNNNHYINFVREIETLKLIGLNSDFNIHDNSYFTDSCSETLETVYCENKYIKEKKFYEVSLFTKFIANINKDKKSVVIDVGAGKGYSSLQLSNCYKLPVLAIESSHAKHKSAIAHMKLINKKHKLSSSLIHYRDCVNDSTDFLKLVKENISGTNDTTNIIICSLHACGSLSDSAIKGFVNTKKVHSLLIVPCCYHLSAVTMANRYEFSKNARMLAQQSPERIQSESNLCPSLFYRAILQVLLKSLGIENAKIGRGAPFENFCAYAKWAFKKLNLENVPTDGQLESLYNKYSEQKWKFEMFQLLRIQLAPLIEAAILLDKILYLENSKLCSNLKLIQIFDPLISPRCWAIVADK